MTGSSFDTSDGIKMTGTVSTCDGAAHHSVALQEGLQCLGQKTPLLPFANMFIEMESKLGEKSTHHSTMTEGNLMAFKTLFFAYAWGVKTLDDLERMNTFMQKPYFLYEDNWEFDVLGPTFLKKELILYFEDFCDQEIPKNLEIKVAKQEDLEEAFDVLSDAWEWSHEIPVKLWENNTDLDPIVAYMDNKMVACLFLQVSSHTSSVYTVSTRKEYRGRKVGKALMAYAIKLASQKGAIGMIIYSTPLGEPMYSSLGFKVKKNWTVMVMDPLRVDELVRPRDTPK